MINKPSYKVGIYGYILNKNTKVFERVKLIGYAKHNNKNCGIFITERGAKVYKPKSLMKEIWFTSKRSVDEYLIEEYYHIEH